MCHLPMNLELQCPCISFFRHVFIRVEIENPHPRLPPKKREKTTRQYASPVEIVMLTVVQNPTSNRGLYIMPQKLMSELRVKLIYSLQIKLKIM